MGGGKSGQGGGTSYQSSSVQIPPEVMARYNAVNTRAEAVANTPWAPYTGEFVAPVNQTQQGGINTITGAAGVDTPYFNQATNAIDQGLSQAGPLYQTGANQVAGGLAAGNWLTGQGIGTATASAGAAAPYNGLAAGQLNTAYGNTQPLNNAAIGLAAGATGAVNPGDLNIGQYMSPYNEGVVQSTLGLLRQDQKMQQNDLRDSQIMEGSFGGDRSGVGKANLQRQQDLAYGNVAAQLYNQNYGQALGAAQQQQGVGLAAGQANRAALASGAQNIAGIGNQQFAQGQAAAQGNLGIGQQIYGQGQGLASTQMQGGNQIYNMGAGAAGTNAGLASGIYNMGAGAAGTYGQLGTQQLQNQLTQGQAQIGAGTVQQQTQQAEDTAKYQQFMQERGYPFQVAQFLANIAMGTGAQSGSTTNTVATQPQPYFSDERLKENVHVIGKTHDGQPIIRFNYKGDPSTQIGLSAQETEKHHPEAVGLSSGFKTVDYDAATRDSIAKAGGGGLSTDMAGILEQQRAMFPGAHDPRGIASGVGPHGIAIAPLKASAPQAAKVDLTRPSQQPTGAKQTIDGALGMYNTGKGLASAYSEGKDTLVGTAGKDGKPGTGGWFGKDGKWNPGEGSASKIFSNDNGLASGSSNAPITTTALAAPTPADSALATAPDPSINPETGLPWARGGRARRAAGGGMPYSDTGGYIPEDLYKPVDPDKPDEGDKAKMAGPSGGGQQKDGTGKAIGSLAGMGIGAMFGMPGVGGMVGSTLGGLFEKGGRVGLKTGGWQGEGDTPEEERGLVLPFRRREPEHTPMPRQTPVSEAGLAAGAGFPVDVPELPPKDEGHRTVPFEFSQDRLPSMDRYAARMPGTPGGLGTPGSTGTADFPPPAASSPRDPGTMFPESGTVPPTGGLASGQSVTSGAPPAPSVTVQATPPQQAATGQNPAPGVALGTTPPAAPTTEVPAMAPSTPVSTPPGFRNMGGQPGVDESAPGFDGAVARTFRFEGGFNPRDANGAPVNFGINQAYHPGVDVSKLTKDQARDIYKRQYWDAIEGDKLDPRLQHMAFDTAVISGPAKAKELLAASGGDPAKFMQLREQFEEGLVKNDPAKYGKYQQSWAARRADLRGGDGQALAFRPEGQTPAAGLATGRPQADPQETPDFIDRAGSWIDRNQRPIMSGLAFIGNMLGSKSHQLTGAIGDGLAAAAPMYMATGFKETELEQGQQRINITERTQYMTVLNQLRAQQAQHVSTYGRPDPAIDSEIAKVTALITAKGGASPMGAQTPGASRGAPQGIPTERTDLQPGAAPAPTVAPAGQPRPGEAPNTPYAMPRANMTDATFKSQIHPEMDPDIWLQKARANATYSPEQSQRDYAKSQQLRQQLMQTGRTIDKDGNELWVPGFREARAAEARQEPNRVIAETQQKIAGQREIIGQQLDALKKVLNDFESGAITSRLSDVNALLAELKIPPIAGGSAADYQKFVKDASKVMIDTAGSMPSGGGPTDMLRNQIASAFASPGLTPEANRTIIAQTDAVKRWNDKYYTDFTKQLEKTPWLDTRQYYDDWTKANPLEKYTKESNREITARGMDLPKTLAEAEDGRRYMWTPKAVFDLYASHPDPEVSKNARIEEIRKKFGDKPRIPMRIVKRPDGTFDLVPE